MQCRGIVAHFAARGKSHEFCLVRAGTCGIFSSYGGDGHFKLGFVQRSQDSCLVRTVTSVIKTRLGSTIRTLLEVRREAKFPLLVGKIILVFLSTFTKAQRSSPFEALNTVYLSKCQRDIRPLVQKSWRTMAFFRISTGDLDIPSSCEMKDEPAFKPLQGNPAFF